MRTEIKVTDNTVNMEVDGETLPISQSTRVNTAAGQQLVSCTGELLDKMLRETLEQVTCHP